MYRMLLLLAIPAIPAPAMITVGAIYNVAAPTTFRMPRGGALATVICSGIRGKPGLLTAPSALPLPFALGSEDVPVIQVFVNGALAPVLSIDIPAEGESGETKITFQVPFERNVSQFDSTTFHHHMVSARHTSNSTRKVCLRKL